MPTKSVSANPEVELVDRFDDAAKPLQSGRYSRSQAIEEAMKMYVSVLDAWSQSAGEPPSNERERRVLTADAITKRVDYHDLTANR